MKDLNQCKSIFTREILSYFNSPIAYIFIVVFCMLMGGLFMTNFFLIGSADMRYFFDLLPIVLCVFIPAITMRIWAEEKKGNTFELLLTFPMNSYKLVLGKFFAGFAFYAATLACTIFIPVMLIFVGKPDLGPIIGGYIGSLLVGAFFLSVGIFISGLCKDQIIAFIVSMIACFFFFLTGLDFIAATIDGWIPGIGSFLKTNFGMTRHFSSFEKGVIDNRDVLYFLVMTGAFLAINIFSIEDRMRPKAKMFFSGAVGVCLAISMVLNSLVSDIPLGRFDLTEGKLYTVTDSTKNILQKLKAPVQLKLYISPSDKMPTALKSLEQDIKDRLEELKIISKGKLNYKVFHMEVAESEKTEEEQTLEDRLQSKGVQPFQVQSIEEDELGIKVVYSAITIGYKEKDEEIIPQVVPRTLHNLEYDIVSKIYRLMLDKKPTVALVAPYTEQALDPQMLALLRQFGQVPSQMRDDDFRILDAVLRYEDYDLRRIQLTEQDPLPEDVDTLIIVAPDSLNDRQRYEINRFLHEGGNVIMAAQGYEYDYQPSRRGVAIMPRKLNHGFNEILSNYGVAISDDLLMDENHEVLSISSGRGGLFGLFNAATPVKAPMQIMVDQESMNQDVSITGRLSSLFYLWGSSLDVNKDKISELGLKRTNLITSSKKSWKVKHRGGSLTQSDIEKYGSYDGRQPLAVLLEGQFPNIFEDKKLPQWPAPNPATATTQTTPEVAPTLTAKPGKLLVIGCSKMFEEQFIQEGGTLNLFVNSVDALTLGGELINIRSHQPINRTIKKLGKMEKLWYRFLTIVLIPMIVIVLGGFRAILRRKEKEQYLTQLKVSGAST